MAHTPGPWEIHHYGDNEGDIHGSDGALVCMMREGDTDPGENWSADARLIASAPELLAALRVAADAIDLAQAQVDSENDRHNLCKRLVAVKRAIAKAEGGE
jgi:hypothetical protein